MADELTGETIASLVAQEGKPVAVPCHGPWTSAEAGVLGRTITSWPSLRTDIRDAGAPPPTPPAAVRSDGVPWRSVSETGLRAAGGRSGEEDRRLGELTARALAARAHRLGIRYPEHLLGQLVAALETGRHVMLTGPPGTGKTTLAHLAAELAGGPGGYLPATATGAWSTADTVGDIVETVDGPVFRPGVFVRAIDEHRWLIVDELNRAPIDRAFGSLFTVLGGQPVVLPHRRHPLGKPLAIVPHGVRPPAGSDVVEVPPSWRIIATMNDFDKRTLHDLSYALMRRFAFIEVLAPDDAELAELLRRHGDHLLALLPLRRLREVGPAVLLDAAEFAARRAADGCTLSRVRYEALFAYLLPQLDGIDAEGARELQALTDPLLAEPERRLLADAVRRVLDVDVT